MNKQMLHKNTIYRNTLPSCLGLRVLRRFLLPVV